MYFPQIDAEPRTNEEWPMYRYRERVQDKPAEAMGTGPVRRNTQLT